MSRKQRYWRCAGSVFSFLAVAGPAESSDLTVITEEGPGQRFSLFPATQRSRNPGDRPNLPTNKRARLDQQLPNQRVHRIIWVTLWTRTVGATPRNSAFKGFPCWCWWLMGRSRKHANMRVVFRPPESDGPSSAGLGFHLLSYTQTFLIIENLQSIYENYIWKQLKK